MAFAILRVAKVKGGGGLGGCADHIERTRKTPNAGPGGIRYLVGGDPAEEVRSRLPAKVRKNAVVAMEHLLTASPEYFRPHNPGAAGTWDKKRTEKWAELAVEWLKGKYGKNLASAVLHLDEATPHIHALVIPKREDGKLDAATLYTPHVLRRLQDSYAEAMKSLGLERGIKGSTAKHENISRYYGRVNGTPPAPQPVPPKPAPLPLKRLVERVPWTQAADQRRRREQEHAKQKRLREQRIAELQAAWDAVAAKAQETERLHKRLAELQATMQKLQRDSVQLQRLPLPDVAQRLGVDVTVTAEQWQWQGGAGRGAVALVQAVLGVGRDDALAWLAAQFSEHELACELAAAAAAEAAEAAARPAPRGWPAASTDAADQSKVKAWADNLGLANVYGTRMGGRLLAVVPGQGGQGAEVLDTSTGEVVRRVRSDVPDPVTVTVTSGDGAAYTVLVSNTVDAAIYARDAAAHGESCRVVSLGGLARDDIDELLPMLHVLPGRVLVAVDDERMAKRIAKALGDRCSGIYPPEQWPQPPQPQEQPQEQPHEKRHGLRM
jgi:hypothetical protein